MLPFHDHASEAIDPARLQPIELRRGERVVRFERPLLLAPMEGITDQRFRASVAACGGVGGLSTDFLRVAGCHFGRSPIRKRLGAAVPGVPCAVQFMAGEPDTALAWSVGNATTVGADWIDLNFGCPAPKVFRNGAGSALLAEPERIAAIVSTACGATDLPVTVKIRVGIDDAAPLDEVLHASLAAGAVGVCLHARRRVDSYRKPADWAWISQAVATVKAIDPTVPVIGNGAATCAGGIHRMLRETGCDGVMVGHGALADPWVFAQAAGAPPPTTAVAAAWVVSFIETLAQTDGWQAPQGRVRQLLRYYRAGGLFADEQQRRALIRERNPQRVHALLARVASGEPVAQVWS